MGPPPLLGQRPRGLPPSLFLLLSPLRRGTFHRRFEGQASLRPRSRGCSRRLLHPPSTRRPVCCPPPSSEFLFSRAPVEAPERDPPQRDGRNSLQPEPPGHECLDGLTINLG